MNFVEKVMLIALLIGFCVLWERESVRRDKERDERIRENRRDKTWEERHEEWKARQ